VALHRKACVEVDAVKDAAFSRIGEFLRAGEPVTEYEIQQFIREQFDRRDLYIDHGPIVAVNAHSGDPHYEPTAGRHAPILEGDWILIDLWAKYRDPLAVYCDITWTGYAGSRVPMKHQEVFDIVTGARDAVVEAVQQAWREEVTIQGWQLDRAARDFITGRGYGEFFAHRTGHSMGVSPTAHALGVNLDDLETHDTRAILPGVGFSVEPGIYLPEFGVRSEIDMYVDPDEGPVVTTSIQREIIRVL
jgi:Xaa-Pro aminopeptidase